MAIEVSSKHLRNAHDLLVLAKIKPGFVPIGDTVSYATRLRALLSGLYELRRVLIERELKISPGPIESLQTIWNTQWAVLPNDRYLLVTVSFDKSWEEYFDILSREGGPALDVIFTHCEGYADSACRDAQGRARYQAFSKWVRERQINCDFYYVGAPDLTVDDVTYLKRIVAQREPSAEGSAAVAVQRATQEIDRARFLSVLGRVKQSRPELSSEEQGALAEKLYAEAKAQGVRKALTAFWDLRKLFPDVIEPDRGAREQQPTAQTVFDRAVKNLLPDAADAPLDALHAGDVRDWLATLKSSVLHTKPTAWDDPRLFDEASAHEIKPVVLEADELSDIQGNILTGYVGTNQGCAVLVRCDSPAHASRFLSYACERVTTQATSTSHALFFNLAVTHAGLARAGVPASALEWLPKEFRDGMESRAASLGDLGPHAHPDFWQLPHPNWDGAGKELRPEPASPHGRVPLSAVDYVVLLQMKRDGSESFASHPLSNEIAELEKAGARVLHVQRLRRSLIDADGKPYPDGIVREHFGFQDGNSQPVPNASVAIEALGDKAAKRDRVALGEVLLGYENERGEVAWCADPKRNPHFAELFARGSFLVIRKLEQDVPAFERFAEDNATALGVAPEAIKAAIVGRDRAGATPTAPYSSKPNDFDYAADQEGKRCPFHSHIRRTNPRTQSPRVPRILRRGFSYGPRFAEAPAETQRGLLFMAFNASIAAQFEVVQRWVNGGNSTGVLSAQGDVFSGSLHPSFAPTFVPTPEGARALVPPKAPFVILRWGLYSFVPSRASIAKLAKIAEQAASTLAASPTRVPFTPLPVEVVELGRRAIAELRRVEAEDGKPDAIAAWKSVIEEPAQARKSAAVWAAIRADQGVLETPYGLLVASDAGAREVLGDGGKSFSVREYWHRLLASTGEHYLSMDPEPGKLASADPNEQAKHAAYEARLTQTSYASESRGANEILSKLFADESAIYAASRAAGAALLDTLSKEEPHEINVREQLGPSVIGSLCRRWFGVGGGTLEEPVDPRVLRLALAAFVEASKFSFQPHPSETIRQIAQEGGETVRNGANLARTPLHEALAQAGHSDDAVTRIVVGSVVGFAAPAINCIALVLDQWGSNGQLGSIAEAHRQAADFGRLRSCVIASLVNTAVPPQLYRTALEGATVSGCPLSAGQKVVVGLASAARDQGDWNWLFGGAYGRETHACPARSAALAAVTGAVAALLERNDLRYSRRFVFAF